MSASGKKNNRKSKKEEKLAEGIECHVKMFCFEIYIYMSHKNNNNSSGGGVGHGDSSSTRIHCIIHYKGERKAICISMWVCVCIYRRRILTNTSTPSTILYSTLLALYTYIILLLLLLIIVITIIFHIFSRIVSPMPANTNTCRHLQCVRYTLCQD